LVYVTGETFCESPVARLVAVAVPVLALVSASSPENRVCVTTTPVSVAVNTSVPEATVVVVAVPSFETNPA